MRAKLKDRTFDKKDPDLIDMGVGNPAFMFPFWGLEDMDTEIGIKEYMMYDYDQLHCQLKTSIKKIHDFVGNAETKGYSVVFGNGASHLVSAWAYSVKAHTFGIQTPYWPRLQLLIELGRSIAPEEKGVAQLMVYPNNPDNSILDIEPDYTSAHDLCYNWPQYTNVKKRKDEVMIFGLAKATGHAGTRFGWALVKNAKQAKAMTKYVELSTSGISQESQVRAFDIFQSILSAKKEGMTSCFDFGKAVLAKRWKTFLDTVKTNKDFQVLNTDGMFAWCLWNEETEDPVEEVKEKYKAVVIGGESFDATKSHFRVSLGCHEDDFKAFIAEVKKGAKC